MQAAAPVEVLDVELLELELFGVLVVKSVVLI